MLLGTGGLIESGAAHAPASASPPASPPNAGAPLPNATFFCDTVSERCYSHVTQLVGTFSEAGGACQAAGGDLVQYAPVGGRAKQRDVEGYFRRRGSLTQEYYWQGASRAGLGLEVLLLDGTPVPTSPGNYEPYAHWDEQLEGALQLEGYDCVLAAAQAAYDLFIGGAGDGSSSRSYTRQPGNADVVYGWQLALCSTPASYVCEAAASSFTCGPPPSPPPRPPSPPSPPMPPAPPSCAPRANTTFFCDALSVRCYSLVAAALPFEEARASCRRLKGGDLVRLESSAEQLDLERYFAARGALVSAYWIGANRTLAPNLYALSDGGYLPQVPSERPDYAHWGWGQQRAAALMESNCARATADASYDIYLGDPASLAQLQDMRRYLLTGAGRKHGWLGTDCRSALPYVCEVPAASYPCKPLPPAPPPPAPTAPPQAPPAPPAAPSAPAAPTCAPPSNASFFCADGWCYSYSRAPLIFPRAQEACRWAARGAAAATALDSTPATWHASRTADRAHCTARHTPPWRPLRCPPIASQPALASCM
jgi:hypothetical protein